MTARANALLFGMAGTTAILGAGVANYALTVLRMPDAGRAPVLASCALLAVVVLMAALTKLSRAVLPA